METTVRTLKDVWHRLCGVRALQIAAKTKGIPTAWKVSGTATVTVTTITGTRIRYTERGSWTAETGAKLSFRNVSQWTLVEHAGVIRLEHLRLGPDKPVHLLDLTLQEGPVLRSVTPHQCGADAYSAVMEVEADAISLCWTVKGPTKDEEILCRYAYEVI